MQIFLGELSEPGLGKLRETEARHCIRVLRHGLGDLIHVVDGQGQKFLGKIVHIEADEVHWTVEEVEEGWGEKKMVIRLGISPLRLRDRFEWAIEKSVELGVNEIFPINCQRTDPHKSKFKTTRIHTILLTALKQSKRSQLPVLQPVCSLSDFLSLPQTDKNFLASCHSTRLLQKYRSDIEGASSLTLLIGPEGDFTESEIALAKETGYKLVSLGQNRLRSETAAIYGLGIFKMICGY